MKRKGNETKNKFRQSKDWVNFRKELLQLRGKVCECCGRTLPSRSLQIHHLEPEHYTDLDPQKFAILCRDCHKEVEKISRRKDLSELRKDYINCYKPFVTGEHTY